MYSYSSLQYYISKPSCERLPALREDIIPNQVDSKIHTFWWAANNPGRRCRVSGKAKKEKRDQDTVKQVLF